MEVCDVVAELRRLRLERKGEYVVVTGDTRSEAAAMLVELGVLMKDTNKRTLLDESHPLVEEAVALAGELFWKEKEWIRPPSAEEQESDKEEQRWMLKQMLNEHAKGVAPPFPVASLADLARLLRTKRDATLGRRMRGGDAPFVAVVSGAGMSVSAGIPDFRSKKTGFYDSFDPAKFGLRSAEDVFSMQQFRADPMPFLKVEREYGGFYGSERFRPTAAHRFVASLAAQGMLVREFTQNVDGLSAAAGVSDALLVEAHGSYRSAHCTRCGVVADVELVKQAVFGGSEPSVPHCPACTRGVLKPNCIFFGEKLPVRFWRERPLIADAEVLLVVGTSLQVEPFASIVDEVRPSCVRVLINKDPVGPFTQLLRDARTFVLCGDIEQQMVELTQLMGWA